MKRLAKGYRGINELGPFQDVETMRAIVIDPFEKSVLEVDLPGSAQSICAALNCDMMEIAVVFETGDVLYVDEEGTLKAEDALQGAAEGERAFGFDVGAHQVFLGKGVILGPENEHGHTDAVMSLARLSSIKFTAPALAFHTSNRLH
jgi:hypothetical protein